MEIPEKQVIRIRWYNVCKNVCRLIPFEVKMKNFVDEIYDKNIKFKVCNSIKICYAEK